MKAWRLYEFGDLRLDEVPTPAVPPGWVRVRVNTFQPSITEALAIAGKPALRPDFVRHRLREEAPVQLFGHEFSGEVAEVGEGVQRLAVGDRVGARATLPCHRCTTCRSGDADRCTAGPMIGMDIPGCFAEELAAPEEAFAVVTPAIDDREAACIQPLASIVASICSAERPTRSAVVVFGLGVMGLFAVQAVRALWQPLVVIGISRRQTARELALSLGADGAYPLDGHGDARAQLAALDRTGADVVFDCSGNPTMAGPGPSPTVQAALELLDPNRQLVEVATFTQPLQIDAGAFHRKSVRYIFPNYTTLKDLETAVELVSSGAVKVAPLLGPIFDGIESLPRALQAIRERGDEHFGPVQVRARFTEVA